MQWKYSLCLFALLIDCHSLASAAEPDWPTGLIGYTEFQANLPGGRHANVRTMRAVVSSANGANRRLVAEELVDNPDL